MQYITNAFDQIRDISYVFNFSEQRQKKLTKIVKGLCNESFNPIQDGGGGFRPPPQEVFLK